MSVFSQTRGTLVSASWWELVREDGSQILKTWVKSPHIFERALVLVVFQTRSVLGWGDSCKESSFQQLSCFRASCTWWCVFLFPKPLFLLFWGLNVLRLADSFQNLLKGVDCLSRNYAHVTLLLCPPLSLTLLSPSPPFFTLFLHIHLFIRTNALVFVSSFTVLADFMEHPGWRHPHPWTPGRTVLLRARNTESLGQILCLGCTGKCCNYLACPGETNFTCVISGITPPPSPACWQSGAPGAELSAHGVWLSPYPWQQATRRSHDPSTTWACWVPWRRIPRSSTLRMLSGQHCNDVKPLCSEVTGSAVPSHRTIALCLHGCGLLTLENH